MKTLTLFLLPILLFSCGGGGDVTDSTIEAPPETVAPETVLPKYNDEEVILLFANAFTLAEGVIEVSQLIESEFIYFAYEKTKTSFRPCSNGGKVHRSFSDVFTDSGQITFVFENCLITPYHYDFGTPDSFFYDGEVTVNYEILERTEALISEYELAGIVNYTLNIASNGLLTNTEEGVVTISFDFKTSINQTWNFDLYSDVLPGEIDKKIEVTNFLAPLFSDTFDQIKNTVISHTQKPDENVTEGETFTGSINGDFVSSLDSSIWTMNSTLRVDGASDTVGGFLNLNGQSDTIGSTVDFGNIQLRYNGEIFGGALYNDLFEKHLIATPTTWALMTYLREQVPIVVVSDNITADIINNDLAEISLEFSVELASSYVSVSNFRSSSYLDIEHDVAGNLISFPSSSLPTSDLFSIDVSVSSKHAGSALYQRYGIDRLNRGDFVSLPNIRAYIPSANVFFGAVNFVMYTYSVDGTKNYSRSITTIINGTCTSRDTGNFFVNDDATDALLEINPQNLSIIASHAQVRIFNVNNSHYCEEKYYIANGAAGENGIFEYDFTSKTSKELSISTQHSNLLIIAHPTLDNAIITANTYGSRNVLEVEVISNLDSDISTKTYAFEDLSTCRYIGDGNGTFLYAETESMRLYACNYVLSLDDPSQVIHKFGDDSNTENILLVDYDLNLILTTQGIYDATNFDLLMDISYLSLQVFDRVMKTNESLFFEVDSSMYFVLDLHQFTSN
jgi:hypothetical protein